MNACADTTSLQWDPPAVRHGENPAERRGGRRREHELIQPRVWRCRAERRKGFIWLWNQGTHKTALVTHHTLSLHTIQSEALESFSFFLFVAGGTKTWGTRESVVHSNPENFTQTSEQPDTHGPAQTYQVNALEVQSRTWGTVCGTHSCSAPRPWIERFLVAFIITWLWNVGLPHVVLPDASPDAKPQSITWGVSSAVSPGNRKCCIAVF